MNDQGKCLSHEHSFMSFRRVSWTAVIVGALVGVGTGFLLNLFSIAIGLTALNSKEGVTTIAIGGLIGIAIGTIASMFIAGWVAGYLGRSYCVKRNLGALYGFTAWCLALLLTVFVVTNVNRYVSVYTNFISHPSAQAFVVNTPDAANTEVKATADTQSMTMLAYTVFFLFILGALSSTLGGHFGMCHVCDDEKYNEPNLKP